LCSRSHDILSNLTPELLPRVFTMARGALVALSLWSCHSIASALVQGGAAREGHDDPLALLHEEVKAMADFMQPLLGLFPPEKDGAKVSAPPATADLSLSGRHVDREAAGPAVKQEPPKLASLPAVPVSAASDAPAVEPAKAPSAVTALKPVANPTVQQAPVHDKVLRRGSPDGGSLDLTVRAEPAHSRVHTAQPVAASVAKQATHRGDEMLAARKADAATTANATAKSSSPDATRTLKVLLRRQPASFQQVDVAERQRLWLLLNSHTPEEQAALAKLAGSDAFKHKLADWCDHDPQQNACKYQNTAVHYCQLLEQAATALVDVSALSTVALGIMDSDDTSNHRAKTTSLLQLPPEVSMPHADSSLLWGTLTTSKAFSQKLAQTCTGLEATHPTCLEASKEPVYCQVLGRAVLALVDTDRLAEQMAATFVASPEHQFKVG